MNLFVRLMAQLKLEWLERRKENLAKRLLGHYEHFDHVDCSMSKRLDANPLDPKAYNRLLVDYQQTLNEIGHLRYKLVAKP